MEPLTTWLCDTCHEPITAEPNDGMVVWKTRRSGPEEEDGNEYYGFMIVHKTISSDPAPRRCDPGDREGYLGSLDLPKFLGPEGLAMLLSWLSPGPVKGYDYCRVASLDEFTDLVRRVQTPWYEQARPHFGDELTQHWLGDANEYYPYLPETLRRIAEGTLGGNTGDTR
jgi:hypothetical protein